MRKLLRADFARLWKNKLFYLFLLILTALGVWLPLAHHRLNQTEGGYAANLTPDSGFCGFGTVAVLLLSILVPLFVGTDHSDGAIRNKLVVGAKRGHVYLSHLLVCLSSLLLLDLAFLLPFFCLALPLLGQFMHGVEATVITGLYTLCMEAAFASLYVFIAMLCQSKAHSAVLCMVLCALLLFFGVWLISQLSEPETYPPSVEFVVGEHGIEDGEFIKHPDEPNPNYVSGTPRRVMQFFYDFTPGGQAIELSTPSGERPWTMPLCSGILFAFSTAAGLLLFQKKDLK